MTTLYNQLAAYLTRKVRDSRSKAHARRARTRVRPRTGKRFGSRVNVKRMKGG